MRVGGTREGRFGPNGRALHEPPVRATRESRALTVVGLPVRREAAPARGDSAFLAHLIATKEQAPQTRVKRRAEPAEALAAYRATADLKI
jgi:hypothetical protein